MIFIFVCIKAISLSLSIIIGLRKSLVNNTYNFHYLILGVISLTYCIGKMIEVKRGSCVI